MDLNQATDWDLIRRSNEDPEYFRYIVERYQNRIFRYVKRISYRDDEDVEDMVQEIFIKVYRNMNEFEPSDKFSSLIYRIAHNHWIDQIRKANRRPDLSTFDDQDALSLIKAGVDMEKEIIDKEMMEKVKAAIAGLPERYREVMVLKFLEEKKTEEIVDILRKPQGSVATLVRRGRELLKKSLSEAGITC